MEISILGFKLNLEVLILIGIIYLILVSHTFCGCSNIPGIIETFSTIANHVNVVTQKEYEKHTSTEGFTGANTNYGQSSPYDLTIDKSINTSSWNAQNMTVVPGQPLSAGVKDFMARKPQPVPLPEGELFMWRENMSDPNCCPGIYYTSSGCICSSPEQMTYLNERGGNRTCGGSKSCYEEY